MYFWPTRFNTRFMTSSPVLSCSRLSPSIVALRRSADGGAGGAAVSSRTRQSIHADMSDRDQAFSMSGHGSIVVGLTDSMALPRQLESDSVVTRLSSPFVPSVAFLATHTSSQRTAAVAAGGAGRWEAKRSGEVLVAVNAIKARSFPLLDISPSHSPLASSCFSLATADSSPPSPWPAARPTLPGLRRRVI